MGGELPMTAPNFASGTVWTGDNLPVMRGINSGCIDLIYLDPPFNSNEDYAAPIGSRAMPSRWKAPTPAKMNAAAIAALT